MNETEQAIEILSHQEKHITAEVDEAGFIDLIVDYDLTVALDHAITAIREKAERENPQPLTLKQLQERIGKPVYIVSGDKLWWILPIIIYKGWLYNDGRNGEPLNLKKYMKTWIPYDYPPKEDRT
ncbi:hypothetical protein [Papillibacter cinnamivorans]|uniref:Uncharacterized protein n=1 Tax=Papillibacter cinnamivorans DSM 12816 TaxID=1122930 RepID=A0A1W1YQA0_9FIRM|nr:hypothetical protein [Papillibacter cinnamivorans]SMC38385.1 hypothetical protein SAMN02745168_0624 [Papillibacter cinnamivorans DSM 12816]